MSFSHVHLSFFHLFFLWRMHSFSYVRGFPCVGFFTVTSFNEASEDLGFYCHFFCCCLLHFGFSQLFSAALPYEGKCQMYGSTASLGHGAQLRPEGIRWRRWQFATGDTASRHRRHPDRRWQVATQGIWTSR